jgi:hypothetical protein
MSLKRAFWLFPAVALLSVSPPAVTPALGQDVTQEATDILRAILLPRVSEILREQGVPAEEVEVAIESARQRGVRPGETTGVFEETARVVAERGPIENFGGFVQAQLDRGLRGRALAEAIRAEHAARGIGRGERIDSDRPGARPGRGRGPPDGAGPGAAGQRPDSDADRPRRPGGSGGER